MSERDNSTVKSTQWSGSGEGQVVVKASTKLPQDCELMRMSESDSITQEYIKTQTVEDKLSSLHFLFFSFSNQSSSRSL